MSNHISAHDFEKPRRAPNGETVMRCYSPGDHQHTHEADRDEEYCAAMGDHLQNYLGDAMQYHNGVVRDNGVWVDIIEIPPTDERPFWTLATCGLGSRSMNTGELKGQVADRCELVLFIPPDWVTAIGYSGDWKWGWPPALLGSLSDSLHSLNTWYGPNHTMTFNGGEPMPTTPFTDVLFTNLAHTEEAQTMHYQGETVQLLQVLPIMPDEREYALHVASEMLYQLQYEYGTLIADPTRPSVVAQAQQFHKAKKRFSREKFTPYQRPLFHDANVLDILGQDVWSEMGDSDRLTSQSQDGSTKVVLQRVEQQLIHVLITDDDEVTIEGYLSTYSLYDEDGTILKPAFLPLPEPAALATAMSIIGMCKGNWWTRED